MKKIMLTTLCLTLCSLALFSSRSFASSAYHEEEAIFASAKLSSPSFSSTHSLVEDETRKIIASAMNYIRQLPAEKRAAFLVLSAHDISRKVVEYFMIKAGKQIWKFAGTPLGKVTFAVIGVWGGKEWLAQRKAAALLPGPVGGVATPPFERVLVNYNKYRKVSR